MRKKQGEDKVSELCHDARLASIMTGIWEQREVLGPNVGVHSVDNFHTNNDGVVIPNN